MQIVTAKLQSVNVAYFKRKNRIIRILCISAWLAVQINPDKWRYTAFLYVVTNLSEADTATTFKVDVSHFGNLKYYAE
jgi:hypothetical protein